MPSGLKQMSLLFYRVSLGASQKHTYGKVFDLFSSDSKEQEFAVLNFEMASDNYFRLHTAIPITLSPYCNLFVFHSLPATGSRHIRFFGLAVLKR